MAYAYEHDGDQGHGTGLGARLRDLFGGLSRRDHYEDDYEDDMVRRQATFSRGGAAAGGGVRVTTVSQTSITVMPASSFGDAQKAADRLKNGEPQIVNFEKTSHESSERLLDFLNGITYALDGYVEKVGDRVYLFTPSNVAIRADTPETQDATRSFFHRH
ncbi:MAG: cell division protein SepF [Armatimonadota bacterium]